MQVNTERLLNQISRQCFGVDVQDLPADVASALMLTYAAGAKVALLQAGDLMLQTAKATGR